MSPRSRRYGRNVRRLARILTDRSGWREAGRAEYAFATSGIIGQGGGLALRFVVSALAIVLLPIGVVSLFLPIGPSTPAATVAYLGGSIGGAVLGVWWLLRRRRSCRDAIVFVACADVLLLISALTMSGYGLVGTTMYFGMLAMLVAFLLGWRILLLHCLFSTAAVIAATVVTVHAHGIAFGELYPVVAPAATIAIALPLIVQFVVEAGRRGLGQVTLERDHDTLTGLYGRRGLDAEMRRRLRGDADGVCVVAVLDLDGFKAFNDAYGHQAGDRRLVETARCLQAGIPTAALARMGGDEFLIVGTGARRADVEAILGAVRALVVAQEGPPLIAASVGVAIVPVRDPRRLPEAIEIADTALYEAKADRSLRIVVRDPCGAVAPAQAPTDPDPRVSGVTAPQTEVRSAPPDR
ncbi:sensor domain-containing diguanylate cyclase [Tsukamurella paurometabola]|uniref:GGDEF domain-containing protein n=1 Tax=Tsukamurella paurometabola TaxID=2061 RepID=A0A3P8K687_TSUPA|nr:GGDEF domain-containing protein [Tsukamurella paurometabola]MBS4099722.1 GGDEF domain-containing protein [Tsukamurella paurometabola]UEA83730.1 GGDEF domain-containing protein [Tsukamurella paurometabola]VDR40869.1 Probable diguanylate cyclase AdrA [Tsukamurella paurometabola]